MKVGDEVFKSTLENEGWTRRGTYNGDDIYGRGTLRITWNELDNRVIMAYVKVDGVVTDVKQ